jgi:hypothetical protein
MAIQAQYVALTTKGGGHWVVLVGEKGESRDSVYQRARTHVSRSSTDDEVNNLIVMSVSATRRAYPEAWRHYEYAKLAGIPY